MNIRTVMALWFAGIASALVGGFAAGQLFDLTPASAAPDSIMVGATSEAVQEHFDLGTGPTGLPRYTDTSCGTKGCAWDYEGDGWRVVLFLDTDAAPPHGPPPSP